jgi:CheY-like chemotaxis protein
MNMNYKTVTNMLCKKRILKILIVDDDIDVANSLKQLLEFRGHHVTIIDEGARCITHCSIFNYDIIFLDYHMEGLNGAQVADIVKKNNSNCNSNCNSTCNTSPTLILAYTGDNSKTAIDLFKNAGMDGLVVKTVDVSDIYILMQNLEWRSKLDKTVMNQIIHKTNKEILFF